MGKSTSSVGYSLVNADLYNRITKTTNSAHQHIQPAPGMGQSHIAPVGQSPGVPDANVFFISLDDSLSPQWLNPLTIEPGEKFGLYRSFASMINPEGSSYFLTTRAVPSCCNVSPYPRRKYFPFSNVKGW